MPFQKGHLPTKGSFQKGHLVMKGWGFQKGHPNYLMHHSEETKKRLSENHKGRLISAETREKISLALKGHIPWNKNKHWWTKEIKKKMIIAHLGKPNLSKGIKRPEFSGENSASWKGDDIGYSGLHYWVRKELGRPMECSECGRKGRKIGKNWSVHWANINHRYKRNLNDWINLCKWCHKKFDNNLNKIYAL